MTNDNYTTTIQVRTTESEKDQIKQKADKQNLSVSAYLRFSALSEKSENKSVNSDDTFNHQVTTVLTNVGNQLNSILQCLEADQTLDIDHMQRLIRSIKQIVARVHRHDRRF